MEKKNKFLAIPAINCSTRACAESKLQAARAMGAEWVHVDVTDGVFSSSSTWNSPETFNNAGMNVEVHLMVTEPERVIEVWLKVGVKRVIVHVESLLGRSEDIFFELLRQCKAHEAELMLSQNPNTSAEEFYPYLETVNAFQFLAVTPGFSGQSFDAQTILKIKTLRDKTKDALIEVDGGVNSLVAKLVHTAGADIVSAASFIWESDNPAASLLALQSA